MSFGAIVLLAIGLAMDAAAVSAGRGLATPHVRARHVLRVAVFFGGAQALMPALGWLLGRRVGPLVQAWDHWIAFGLLAAIGAKMLWEARAAASDDAPGEPEADIFGTKVMLVLAVATSLDALAVGVTFPMLDVPLVSSLATIGLTTAVLSALALFAGHRFGAVLGKRLDALGGVVLIGLGIKILLDHLGAA